MARVPDCDYPGCSGRRVEWSSYCSQHYSLGLRPSTPCQQSGCSNTTHEALKCARCDKLFCQFHLKDNHDGCRLPN